MYRSTMLQRLGVNSWPLTSTSTFFPPCHIAQPFHHPPRNLASVSITSTYAVHDNYKHMDLADNICLLAGMPAALQHLLENRPRRKI